MKIDNLQEINFMGDFPIFKKDSKNFIRSEIFGVPLYIILFIGIILKGIKR